MPTYDYRCTTCGTEFELFQSFSDASLTKCPTKKSGNAPESCTSPGRGRVEKVFRAPGITFKGDGFYKTDSRSSSTKASTSESSSSTDSSKSSKSDAAASSSTSSSDSTSPSSDKA